MILVISLIISVAVVHMQNRPKAVVQLQQWEIYKKVKFSFKKTNFILLSYFFIIIIVSSLHQIK